MQLAYYGPWPIRESRAQSGMEYLVCIGSEFGPPRTLVSVFSNQWMVYQQTASQPSPLCAERAAPVVAGADDWEWPYLVDDSLRLCASAEQDEADQEVDDWFAEEALKRNRLVDEVRAESGETEFRAGQALRTQWFAAQRADPALAKKINAKTLEAGYRRGVAPAPCRGRERFEAAARRQRLHGGGEAAGGAEAAAASAAAGGRA